MNRLAASAGVAVLAAVLCLTFGAVAALLTRAEAGRGLTPADWAAVRFTLMQAVLSAAISCALAVPLARALMRRRFVGRGTLIALLGAPFLLPVIVAVLGLLAVWGRGGAVSQGLVALDLPRISIYGLPGVLLAHVFFNLPLVTRLLVQGWQTIPAEHFRLAAQLGMGPRAVFRRLEAPMLASVLPGAFLLVFLLCMTSFAVALALGGGPRATTIELAIYQALRFEFDLGAAARLALVQFTLCGAVALAALAVTRPAIFGPARGRVVERWDARTPGLRTFDTAMIAVLVLFLATPMLFVLARGTAALASGVPQGMLAAAGTSLAVATASAALAGGMALALAVLVAGLPRGRGVLVEGVGLLMLAASPFVVGTGLFIVLNPVADPFALALPLTGLINAAASLPFGLRALVPALREGQTRFGPLADSLGMSGWARFRLVTWPVIRRPMGFALGLAAALSMGDLGVITLFAPPGVETLPLYMYRLMGAYRMADATGAALMLLVLSLALFWLFDRGGRLEPVV